MKLSEAASRYMTCNVYDLELKDYPITSIKCRPYRCSVCHKFKYPNRKNELGAWNQSWRGIKTRAGWILVCENCSTQHNRTDIIMSTEKNGWGTFCHDGDLHKIHSDLLSTQLLRDDFGDYEVADLG